MRKEEEMSWGYDAEKGRIHSCLFASFVNWECPLPRCTRSHYGEKRQLPLLCLPPPLPRPKAVWMGGVFSVRETASVGSLKPQCLQYTWACPLIALCGQTTCWSMWSQSHNFGPELNRLLDFQTKISHGQWFGLLINPSFQKNLYEWSSQFGAHFLPGSINSPPVLSIL